MIKEQISTQTNGLNADDIQLFMDLLIKANEGQLKYMEDEVIKELNKRWKE